MTPDLSYKLVVTVARGGTWDSCALSNLQPTVISAHDYIVMATSNHKVGDVQYLPRSYPKHLHSTPSRLRLTLKCSTALFHSYSCVSHQAHVNSKCRYVLLRLSQQLVASQSSALFTMEGLQTSDTPIRRCRWGRSRPSRTSTTSQCREQLHLHTVEGPDGTEGTTQTTSSTEGMITVLFSPCMCLCVQRLKVPMKWSYYFFNVTCWNRSGRIVEYFLWFYWLNFLVNPLVDHDITTKNEQEVAAFQAVQGPIHLYCILVFKVIFYWAKIHVKCLSVLKRAL